MVELQLQCVLCADGKREKRGWERTLQFIVAFNKLEGSQDNKQGDNQQRHDSVHSSIESLLDCCEPRQNIEPPTPVTLSNKATVSSETFDISIGGSECVATIANSSETGIMSRGASTVTSPVSNCDHTSTSEASVSKNKPSLSSTLLQDNDQASSSVRSCHSSSAPKTHDDCEVVAPSVSHFICPVCSFKVESDLQFFNAHLDSCLSKAAIKDLVGGTVSVTSHHVSSASNNNNLAKRSPAASKQRSSKDAKRRKLNRDQPSMSRFLSQNPS